MANRILNVNTDQLVIYTNKLEKMHRSDFPLAVRGALNSAAFDVKTNTLQQQSKNVFDNIRRPSFFKKFSGVDTAKGFNIKTMKATAGMIQKGNDEAAGNMPQQETGGTIKSRSFIPMDAARVSGSHSKAVRKRDRISKIKNIKQRIRRGDKSGLFRAANREGVGGHLIYADVLYRVKNIRRGNLKMTPLHSFKKNRSIKVKGTGLVRKSGFQSGRKIGDFYIAAAKKRFARL